jgi:toxin FitB
VIIIDTNLISEPLRNRPDTAIRDWLNEQDGDALYLTVITVAELLAGAAQLPLGRRRSGLEHRILSILADFSERRILSFDLPAARCYAVLRARARAAGLGIGALDAQIAAIATAHGFSVATRDTAPFIAAGVPVIDPWRDTGA